MSIAVFLPLRRGSERVQNKNTRPFGGLKNGLLELKLIQLERLEGVNEVVISSNDPECLKIAEEFKNRIKSLKIIERPEFLGTSETRLSDLIKYAGTITSSDYILWTHVTSPFFDEVFYKKAISKFFEVEKIGYDSLVTGQKFQEFLMNKETYEIVNNLTSTNWPRTQDLEEWFKIDNAVFLARSVSYKKGERLGKKPFVMEIDKRSGWDIDEWEDFKIAEAIYEKI